eukprot:1777381-Karenia_brevis.AAC.1
MHKVASSAISWGVGSWTTNQADLGVLRNAFFNEIRPYMRFGRAPGTTDEKYHREVHQAMRILKDDLKLPDFDVLLLSQLYNYAGHL